jgi:hypothetical protein
VDDSIMSDCPYQTASENSIWSMNRRIRGQRTRRWSLTFQEVTEGVWIHWDRQFMKIRPYYLTNDFQILSICLSNLGHGTTFMQPRL